MNIGKFDFMSQMCFCLFVCVLFIMECFLSSIFSIFILGDVGNVTSDKNRSNEGEKYPKG